jgi:hypothetical protein
MNLEITQDQIPLWQGANGKFQADVNVPAPTDPLPVSANAIASLSFSAAGKAALGKDVSLGVSASTSVKLAALFQEQTGADPDLVTEFNLTPSLKADNLLLALDLGGKADVTVSGSYTYNVLSVGANLAAGADGRLVHVRPYPRGESSLEILQDFFQNLALPGTISAPPPPGQVTSLEYGGYLNFGVNASAGYQMKGTHNFQDIGALKLSEHYQLSVTGKLSVNAKLAGRFSIKVESADDDHWAHVSVTRQRSKDLQIAADLNVGAQVNTQGLPASGKEFLESLLGLRAKNWISLADSIIQQSAAIHTKDDLMNKLDGLADIYVSKYVGKAVDQFLPADVVDLMGKLKNVVDSYNNVEDSAVALFDRYFDVAKSKLLPILQQLSGLTSWAQFQGEVDPLVWNVVQQLTSGSVLDSILQQTTGLSSLQDAANKAISLIQDDAHDAIRKYIGLAKQEFGLDPVMAELARVDSPDGLKTQLSDISQHVVQRIVGKAVTQVSDKDFKAITSFVQEVQKGEAGFFQKFDQVLQEAASQSFSLDIAAAYERSDEKNALIDVEIRLQNDDAARTPNAQGQKFMRSAGLGDFSEILAQYDPSVVRLKSGQLTHNFSSSSGLTINIAGWHDHFQYNDSYKVVTQSDQQISSTAGGMLNVFTTVDVSAQHTKTRKMNQHEQQMQSNFTLRFLAETKTTVTDSKFDSRDKNYLLDVITGQTATYANTLTNSNTTPAQLDNLLAFGKQLGLDQKGATATALQPILKLQAGSYGPVDAEYRVQFSAAGLSSLFRGGNPVTEQQIRTILQRIIVANYAGDEGLAPVGWLYCSDKVRELALGQGNFAAADTILGGALAKGDVQIAVPFPGMKPVVRNDNLTRVLVRSLFIIEKDLIASFLQLQGLVNLPAIVLKDLEKASASFGKALNEFEGSAELSRSMVSPAFAVFDGLIQLATPAAKARSSALSLKVGANGAAQHQMLFQLVSEPAAKRAAESPN